MAFLPRIFCFFAIVFVFCQAKAHNVFVQLIKTVFAK